MEYLAEWLKRIIGMIIIAGFFEMILPDNQLRNVTKMILGLIIMLMLLQPLTRLFALPAAVVGAFGHQATSQQVASDTARILREGKQLRQTGLLAGQTGTKSDLEFKLRQVLGLFDQVELRNLNLRYQDAQLQKACIGVILREPGYVQAQQIRARLRHKLEGAIGLFTGLTPEQIEIRWEDEHEE